MKLAILCAAVDPRIGGVLVFGDRGTGKSTAVRALARAAAEDEGRGGLPLCLRPGRHLVVLRPVPDAEAGKPKTHLVPVPVVDLPLGATEDRVVGALDLEKALTAGIKALRARAAGARAPRLPVHRRGEPARRPPVDLLIDVAASGENVVERESLSVRHPRALRAGGQRQPGGR